MAALPALFMSVFMHDRPLNRFIMRLRLIYISITLVFLVSACSSPPASVVDRDQPPSRKLQEHLVGPGETLYSIAWRYDVEHRRLAQRNGIKPPFTIYPGQVLKLDVGAVSLNDTASNTPAKSPNKPASKATKPPAQTAQSQPVAPPRKPKPDASRSKKETASSGDSSPVTLPSGTPNWRWPVQGRVLRAFGASTGLNQGIDISGNLGDSVQAAAPGQVVYAGSGLRGYGNLVILKHNDTYLSAYAHNRRLQVSEGDVVKAGETIAEMGSSGTEKVKLYFEIRRDGKPVDPIRHLPKR